MPSLPLVIQVMLRPRKTYEKLARDSQNPTTLEMLRRPALFAFLLGCSLALSTIGRFSLRVIVTGTLLWAFAPLLQILAASGVLLLLGGRRHSLRAGIALMFLGIGPWSFWILTVAALFSFIPPESAVVWIAGRVTSPLDTVALPFLWSAFVTFGFFRGALAWSRPKSACALVLYHALAWGPPVLFFLASDQLLPRLARVPAP